MGRRAAPGEAGFSLLELIAVLAIVALASAMVAPSLRGPIAAAGVDAAASRLAAAFRFARAESLRSGTDQSVMLDPAGNRFWAEGAAGIERIDPAVRILIEDDNLEYAAAARRVRFQPDGRATGAQIVLADDRREVGVAVDWLTGATRMIRRR